MLPRDEAEFWQLLYVDGGRATTVRAATVRTNIAYSVILVKDGKEELDKTIQLVHDMVGNPGT
jgi:predicted Zn-dependent peptidase